MWPAGDANIEAQTHQWQADILELRGEQKDLQHRLEGAGQDELAGRIAFDHANDAGDTAGTVRALHVIDAALCVQTLCRRLIDEHVEAIGSLQDEIAALPLPRKPVEP